MKRQPLVLFGLLRPHWEAHSGFAATEVLSNGPQSQLTVVEVPAK